MDSPGTHSFTAWRVASPQNWGLRHYVPTFLCEPMYLRSSLSLRISRLSGEMGVWGNLGVLVMGLGRQQEFCFVKYFKVLTLVSKGNKTKTLSIAFAKNKIKIIIGGKKGKNLQSTHGTIANSSGFTWEVVINLEEEDHSFHQPTHHPRVCLPGLEVLYCTQGKKMLSVFFIKSKQQTIGP